MNTDALSHRKQSIVTIAAGLVLVSLVLAGCGTPAVVAVRNLTDATATPQAQSGMGATPTMDMAMDTMPGMAASTAPNIPATIGATTAVNPAASSTDYVLIWILYGTPTSTPVVQRTAVPSSSVSGTAVSVATTPTVTRPASTSVPPTPTVGAAQNAADNRPGDPAKGQIIFTTIGGCNACHDVSSGTTLVGPSLKGVASRAGSRKPGMSASDYLHESILSPNVYVVQGFQPGIMLQNLAQVLTPQQVNDVVAYLMTLK